MRRSRLNKLAALNDADVDLALALEGRAASHASQHFQAASRPTKHLLEPVIGWPGMGLSLGVILTMQDVIKS